MSHVQRNFLSDLEWLTQTILNNTRPSLDTLSEYVDLDFAVWLKWFLSPLILTFVIFPSVILLFIYISSLILFIYRAQRRARLRQRLASSLEHMEFWKAGRLLVATLWDFHAWLWHGYEVDGMDNIPEQGGALLLYYHGAAPVDYYYLTHRLLLVKGILIHSVVDKFLYSVPGFRIILDAFCCTPGTVDSCAGVMREGNILGLSPGGVYEAQFGDNNYELLWRDRLGFAKAAIAAGVPVVPVFTENIREAFRVVDVGGRFFYWLFRKTKLPLKPLYGGFPVKLVTHVGEPIRVESGMRPEELRDRCKEALEHLIQKNQKLPGSIFRAVLNRFNYKAKST